ncbi:NAD(P)/FAD-dependent oxidoreductase [Sphingobacterium sp.]|uniref:NAD(P)/FAD-dependent oxidoreductase n=1 Tax=Sphingobacterium sp. TaxID=341027 RepID=UPI002896DCE4|nr:NAD(P)/FAD-dependent oxidoreductase [Sphingobacterium sp.]
MVHNPDVIIIGGGLAGLTSASHLCKKGLNVVLIEKHIYPQHKVCGEYISSEILPYLKELDIDVEALHPSSIKNLEFTAVDGKMIKAELPLGGIGLSRYALDDLLYRKAKDSGCIFITATVSGISFEDDMFTVSFQHQVLKSKILLGAYGKRANIDQILGRSFIQKESAWMAIKGHYVGNFPDDLIGLHNFKGGYCGISKIENNRINVCYLADIESFKKYKNIDNYQKHVLYKNKHIKFFLENSSLIFEKPLTISQISFCKKRAIENHMIMIGDTAGLIHPLCGNGMAMAIHSAKIASELILDYFLGEISNRKLLERMYVKRWKKNFERRLLFGKVIARILQFEFSTKLVFNVAKLFPALITWIIKQTHGTAKVN